MRNRKIINGISLSIIGVVAVVIVVAAITSGGSEPTVDQCLERRGLVFAARQAHGNHIWRDGERRANVIDWSLDSGNVIDLGIVTISHEAAAETAARLSRSPTIGAVTCCSRRKATTRWTRSETPSTPPTQHGTSTPKRIAIGRGRISGRQPGKFGLTGAETPQEAPYAARAHGGGTRLSGEAVSEPLRASYGICFRRDRVKQTDSADSKSSSLLGSSPLRG